MQKAEQAREGFLRHLWRGGDDPSIDPSELRLLPEGLCELFGGLRQGLLLRWARLTKLPWEEVGVGQVDPDLVFELWRRLVVCVLELSKLAGQLPRPGHLLVQSWSCFGGR